VGWRQQNPGGGVAVSVGTAMDVTGAAGSVVVVVVAPSVASGPGPQRRATRVWRLRKHAANCRSLCGCSKGVVDYSTRKTLGEGRLRLVDQFDWRRFAMAMFLVAGSFESRALSPMETRSASHQMIPRSGIWSPAPTRSNAMLSEPAQLRLDAIDALETHYARWISPTPPTSPWWRAEFVPINVRLIHPYSDC
jgi:hypothetical protein